MVCKDPTEQGNILPALEERCNLWSMTPGSLAAAGEVRNSLGQKVLLSKDVDEGGWEGGLKTCPKDWAAGRSLSQSVPGFRGQWVRGQEDGELVSLGRSARITTLVGNGPGRLELQGWHTVRMLVLSTGYP